MAIGLGRMFGIVLPLNFDSPLKSQSISELWRRWHITLSRFLREYLYFPLGGSRCSLPRTCQNLIFTMVLCGLWHGAGWTFIVWGGIHGLFLCIEQCGRRLSRTTRTTHQTSRLSVAIRVVWTFLLFSLSMVFFRAESLAGAANILATLVGTTIASGRYANSSIPIDLLASGARTWCAIGLAVVWFCPNTQQIMGRFEPALGYRYRPIGSRLKRWFESRIQWRPHWAFAVMSALALGIAISAMTKAQEFIYFQF